jgi:hypothetical protein
MLLIDSPGQAARAAAKVALLPQVVPVFRHLVWVLGLMVHLVAQLFAAAGLIDRGHPALSSASIGQHRLGEVLGVAGRRVVAVGTWQQAVVFGATVGLMVGVGWAVFAMGMQVLFGVALAAAPQLVESDVGGELIRRLFTVSGTLDTSLAGSLRSMLAVFSGAALVVGMVVAGYTGVAILTKEAGALARDIIEDDASLVAVAKSGDLALVREAQQSGDRVLALEAAEQLGHEDWHDDEWEAA